MTKPFHISLFEGTLHVDKIHVRFKIANITHALPVPVYRQTDFTPNRWSFRVYMIPLRDFVPEWVSRPGTRTGVNSRRGDSRRHDILWWYHINKYRTMRGNRSELALGRKSHGVSSKKPLKFPLRAKCWIRGRVGGHFPESYNEPTLACLSGSLEI